MRTGKTHAKETRLRREPDHAAETLAVLPPGTEVQVLEEHERFLKVHVRDAFRDQIGYVAAGFLEFEPPPDPDERPVVPCPHCQGTDFGVFPVSSHGAMYIVTGLLSYHEVMARVCLDCGQVEFCVRPDSLPELRQARKVGKRS